MPSINPSDGAEPSCQRCLHRFMDAVKVHGLVSKQPRRVYGHAKRPVTEGGSAHPFTFSVGLGALVCKHYQVLPDGILEGCSATSASIPRHTFSFTARNMVSGVLASVCYRLCARITLHIVRLDLHNLLISQGFFLFISVTLPLGLHPFCFMHSDTSLLSQHLVRTP